MVISSFIPGLAAAALMATELILSLKGLQMEAIDAFARLKAGFIWRVDGTLDVKKNQKMLK